MKPVLVPVFACASLALLANPGAAQEAPTTPTVDFGNHSSETITGKAWGAYDAKNYGLVLTYANKCIELYQKKAVEMQKALTAPLTEKEEIFKQWALNDVATCYFLKGQALEAKGKKTEAAAAYKFLADNLSFGQCWDTKGWFWKPADAAREKVKALEFEKL